MRYSRTALLLGAILICGSCDTGRRSSAGFRLPDGGDAERGKAAFVALECHTCHEVAGVDLPRSAAQQARIVLGGPVAREISDGYLVTSIINPPYRLAHPMKRFTTVGDKPRMPDYGDKLTVRQLTDLVTFLQSRYEVRLPAPRYPNYY